MRGEKPQYQRDVESLLSSIDSIESWSSESNGNGGTDYRVFVADGSTITEATDAVEMAPAPANCDISISSATDEWFWVGVTPR